MLVDETNYQSRSGSFLGIVASCFYFVRTQFGLLFCVVVEFTDGKSKAEAARIPKLMINRFRLQTEEMAVQCFPCWVMVGRLVP